MGGHYGSLNVKCSGNWIDDESEPPKEFTMAVLGWKKI